MEDIREFEPRSLRGPKGEFQAAVKRFTKRASKHMAEHPEAYEGLKFTRFEGNGYASKNGADEAARRGIRLALEAGHVLDYRTAPNPAGRWFVYYRLDPEAR